MPPRRGDQPPPIAGGSGDPATNPKAAGTRRPTPADPYPEARPATIDDRHGKYPPELGPDAIAILEGRSFMFSDSLGDVPAGSIGGFVHDDTRFLSYWQLKIDGQRPSLLKSRVVDYYSAAFFCTNQELAACPAGELSIRRLRFVGEGVHEKITIHSAANGPVNLELSLCVGTDFADLFEIKTSVRDRSDQIQVEVGPGIVAEHIMAIKYENKGFQAETHVHAQLKPDRIDGTDLIWDIELPPRGKWHNEISVVAILDGRRLEPVHQEFGEAQSREEGALTRWLENVPRFQSDCADLKSVFDKSVVDLAALRLSEHYLDMDYVLPAAGLPWFMTVFGRDTLITALQTLWIGPELARGALELLGGMQGKEVNDFRDEEPGKILHEFRRGELAKLGEQPHSPYYGTADATPLYLILMSEYWRFTGDDYFVRDHWNGILRALEWIDRYGDRDGDGYVEYQTRSSQGLGNQGWKDSWDGIQFSDGRIPYLPIATAEIQGYVYRAKIRVAELAERLFEDAEVADRLKKEAEALRERFNRDFWSDYRGGFYVIGLDGDKQQIDSKSSNMAHLLWSGIVPEERGSAVRDQLMSDAMFSGWGVRTLSREDRGFNPIGYHTGTVWPHDNAMIAMGLARYGFREEANRIVLAMLDAAKFTEFRLPEVFAGYDRDVGSFPVPYPTACSPQAWATGAPFVFLRVMLGLDARDAQVVLDPRIPEEIGRIYLHGMHAFGTHWDIEAIGTNSHVRLTH